MDRKAEKIKLRRLLLAALLVGVGIGLFRDVVRADSDRQNVTAEASEISAVPNPGSYFPFANLNNPNGQILAANMTPAQPITRLSFKNLGSETAYVSHLNIRSGKKVIQALPGDEAVGIASGQTTEVLFSNNDPVMVESIEFAISGATGVIEIHGINQSNPVPGGFSSGNAPQ